MHYKRTFERENALLGIHNRRVGVDRSTQWIARVGEIDNDYLRRVADRLTYALHQRRERAPE